MQSDAANITIILTMLIVPGVLAALSGFVISRRSSCRALGSAFVLTYVFSLPVVVLSFHLMGRSELRSAVAQYEYFGSYDLEITRLGPVFMGYHITQTTGPRAGTGEDTRRSPREFLTLTLFLGSLSLCAMGLTNWFIWRGRRGYTGGDRAS